MSLDVELRKLAPGPVFGIVQILECGEAWKQLMALIPVELEETNPKKYTMEHIKMIECAGQKQQRPCSQILLEEWGTSGRNRPRLSSLLKLLVKAQLFRAAEYVAVELLKELPPERPTTGPAARVLIPDVDLLPLVATVPGWQPPRVDNQNPREIVGATNQVLPNNELPPPDDQILGDAQCRDLHITYSELFTATRGFDQGSLLGKGAWGSVYLGILEERNRPTDMKVAVKKLHAEGAPGDPVSQFRSEVEQLSQLAHPNLLPLVGYSSDGPSLCLVYHYMENGSLEDRLASQDVLQWRMRLDIAEKSAEGILYLHTALPKPLVHRDVKSANILLDMNMEPKLGDFGLVRMGATGERNHSMVVTSTAVGTSAYMAPEAFHGDISVKLDVFSFGVVLLELLTGLPPYDDNREERDIVSYIMDQNDEIEKFLDTRAGNWGPGKETELYELTLNCLEHRKNKRPNMTFVLQRLKAIEKS